MSTPSVITCQPKLIYDGSNESDFMDLRRLYIGPHEFDFRISELKSISSNDHILQVLLKSISPLIDINEVIPDYPIYLSRRTGLSLKFSAFTLSNQKQIAVMSFAETQPGRYQCFFEGICNDYGDLILPSGFSFYKNKLNVKNLDQLDDAYRLIPYEKVTQLSLGARCVSGITIDALTQRITYLQKLNTISLSDDLIPNCEMPKIKEAFNRAFPVIDFKWTYDCLAGGKHGR